MTDSIPNDLQRLVKLSSSYRKILLVVALPALLFGAIFSFQGRPLPALISFVVMALFGYVALKPKNVRKNKAVALLTTRPADVTRVSVIRQRAMGAKSAQLYLFAQRKHAEASLLVDDVRNLDEALTIIGRYAPNASVDVEEVHIR